VLLVLTNKHATIYRYENALIATNGSARTVLNELELNTLQAHRVLASQVINGVTYSSGANVLVLQLPTTDSSGNFVANSWDYLAIYTSGAQIWEQTQAATGSHRYTGSRLLSNSLKTLSFSYDNVSFPSVKKVSVDLTTEAIYQTTKVVDTHLKQTLRLKNY